MSYPQTPPPPPYQAQAAVGPGDLSYPLYGASIGQAFTRFWKKYATFGGRASRSEFWWWVLIAFVINLVISIIERAIGGGTTVSQSTDLTSTNNLIGAIWGLVIIVPSLALAVRRLHDTNRSGWWVLIGLIPLVGWIILIVFYASASDPRGARYDATRASAQY